MAKAKTSHKQKKSLENIQNSKLKTYKDIMPYSPTEEILQGDLIGRAIFECLKNNDPEGVMEVISIYLNTVK
jgi:hypothetical protein